MAADNYDILLNPIKPHGGQLVHCLLRGEEKQTARTQANSFLKLDLNEINLTDLELIASGAFSPLCGFMGEADYQRVLLEMRLHNGLVWTLPITLAVDEETAVSITPPQKITLCENGRPLAIMQVNEKFTYDKNQAALLLFKGATSDHPGLQQLQKQGPILLGGEIDVFDLPETAVTQFPEMRHTPAQTRRMFARRGWKRIVAFQTSSLAHRAHEHIQKTALEIVDGLFLHLTVGQSGADVLPDDVRVASYETILRDYYPADTVLLGVFPNLTRHTGPREAVVQALIHKNFGCTHYILSPKQPAQFASYTSTDIQQLFSSFSKEEIGIEILPFQDAFFCKKCDTFVTVKTCPHDKADWITFSSSQVHDHLTRGETLPVAYTRPEVLKVVLAGLQAKNKK